MLKLMKFTGLFEKAAPYLVAAVLFVLAACIYCSPVLKGKSLYAGDIQNYQGAVHESLEYHRNTGDYTFWTGSMFSGMPNYQIGGGSYDSERLLAPLAGILSHKDNPLRMIILYLVCFFIMMRCFGVNRWLSIAGAFAVALSSYFFVIIPAGHFTKVTTIALSAVIIGAFYLIFRKKYLLGSVLAMAFTAIAFKLHPQMFYYFCMMMGLMWIAELFIHIREKRYRDLVFGTVIFALSLLVGVGTGSANVFANAEYASETMRGRHSDLVAEGAGTENVKGLDIDYATQWSYGIGETMSFMIPGFMGGANTVDVGKDSGLYETLTSQGVSPSYAAEFCGAAPMYWGDQPFTAGNVYAGAVVCFLFLLGLLIVEGPYKWALLAATLFSFALSWGHNFQWLTELFFKYFPMYSKFRAVSSILVVAEVAMPLLGFLALKRIFDGEVGRTKLCRSICIASGITGGICLCLALFGGMLFSFTSQYDASWASQMPDWLYAAIVEQRADILRSDSFRSFLFIAAAALALWLNSKGILRKGWLAAVLCILIVCDMWPVDRRYFNDGNFIPARARSAAFKMEDYEKALLQEPGHFRVLNLTTNTFNDSRTSYYLKSVGGYSAAKLRRYNDLIEQYLSKMDLPVLGMLNARYIITRGDDGAAAIQVNPYALGNAWFVDRLVTVDNANQESDALAQIDLGHEAVLDKSFSQYVEDYDPSVPEDAFVTLNSYSPKELDYTSSSSQPGTIVFSEIYYPYGWKVTVDGQNADHFRVDYLLRAVNVPAGEHNIHFIFDPDSVHKGNAIATVCIVLMYLLAASALAYGVVGLIGKRRKE